MPTDATIERRLIAVEEAIAEIRQRLASGPPAADWVERFTGSFADEPAFAEVVAYGQAIRRAAGLAVIVPTPVGEGSVGS